MTKLFTPVRIKADVYDDLKQLAGDDQRSVTQYVDVALRDHIKRVSGRGSRPRGLGVKKQPKGQT